MLGNYLEQALGMIHSRRLAAEQQNRERIMEIESRIPEVSEVNYQMFRTSRDLMQIIVKGENTKERVAAEPTGPGDDPPAAERTRLSGGLSGTPLHLLKMQ